MVPARRRPLPSLTGRARAAARLGPACLLAAVALLAPPPAAAAGLRLAPAAARGALPGCDNPTPVRGRTARSTPTFPTAPSAAAAKVSTGWVRLEPDLRWVPSGLTAHGDGASGRKLSGAVVEGGTLYLLERNLTSSGGMRVGRSASVAEPSVTWTASLDFGWGSFAQASPDGYEYVYLRDSPSAYGSADRVDLARVPKGSVADLAAWQVFAGSPAAPAWVPWTNRAARKPVLSRPRQDQPPARQSPRRVLDDGGHHAAPAAAGAGTGSRSTRRASPTGRGTAGTTSPGRTWARARSSRRCSPARLLLTRGRPVRVAAVLHAGRLLSRTASAPAT